MAASESNRVSFLVNSVNRCKNFATRGMGNSGRAADRCLRGHILATEAILASNDHEASVDIRPLSDSSPLSNGRGNSHKAEYGHILSANVAYHLQYLNTSAAVIMVELRKVLMRSRDHANVKIVCKRSDPFGAIQPPDTEEVIQVLADCVTNMDPEMVLETKYVTESLDALDIEREEFRRENVINNAFTSAWNESKNVFGVFELPGNYKNWQKVVIGDGTDQYSLSAIHPGVVKRKPEESTAWRTTSDSQFPFVGLWGPEGRGVDESTLENFLTRVVAPHAGLATVAAIVTTHLRQHVNCAAAIMFGRSHGFDEGRAYCSDMPESYQSWSSWRRLRVTLDWFTLIWRLILYANSRVRDFLSGDSCAKLILAGLLESWPPILFDEAWFYDVLLSAWPGTERQSCPPDPRTVANLISTAVVAPPGQTHSIFGNVVQRMQWHRLSFRSAAFLCSFVLGRVLKEETAGTQMLVVNSTRADTTKGEKQFGALALPSAAECINPFLSNQLYRTKMVWSGDTDSTHKFMSRMLNQCLQVLSPIFESGADRSSSDWISLILFPVSQLEVVVGNLWRQYAQTKGEQTPIIIKLLNRAKRDTAGMVQALGKAVEQLDGGLVEQIKSVEKSEEILGRINERREAVAKTAEIALYNVAVWVEALGEIMDTVGIFPTS